MFSKLRGNDLSADPPPTTQPLQRNSTGSREPGGHATRAPASQSQVARRRA